jgi:hypothetical protein
MGNKARSYTEPTKKRLFALSGNECYEPNCNRRLIAEDGKTIVAKICHIEAASEKGPRYNSDMNDDDRRNFNNLILLCDEHHTIIDNKENERSYPTPLLCEWKKNHESKLLNNSLRKNSTLLSQAINVLANIEMDNKPADNIEINTFNISEKINYNCIKENRYLIEEYKVYYGKIDSLYDELEKSGSFKKEKLLSIIRIIYLKIKGKYTANKDSEIGAIRENSDKIIDDIQTYLFEEIEKTKLDVHDDAFIAIPIIMVDAFMRCKILEKPIS